MNDCQCKSGFFALRDCGQPSIAQCETCSRAMCHAHAAVESRFTQCRDCWTRGTQTKDPRDRRNDNFDDDWANSYRSRYYAGGYAPIYTGTHYHHYYDQYDTRSFRQQEGEIEDGSDNARAGFGDS